VTLNGKEHAKHYLKPLVTLQSYVAGLVPKRCTLWCLWQAPSTGGMLQLVV
jgi:hypothetical protein